MQPTFFVSSAYSLALKDAPLSLTRREEFDERLDGRDRETRKQSLVLRPKRINIGGLIYM